jgi:hypothetical protein
MLASCCVCAGFGGRNELAWYTGQRGSVLAFEPKTVEREVSLHSNCNDSECLLEFPHQDCAKFWSTGVLVFFYAIAPIMSLDIIFIVWIWKGQQPHSFFRF